MNGTTFNHGKATQDAEQIINIVKKVQALFNETKAEIAKVKQNWQTSGTQQNSAENAFNLFNSYEQNFDGFTKKINDKANQIYRASATYSETEVSTNKAVDAGFKIGGAGVAAAAAKPAVSGVAASTTKTATIGGTTPTATVKPATATTASATVTPSATVKPAVGVATPSATVTPAVKPAATVTPTVSAAKVK